VGTDHREYEAHGLLWRLSDREWLYRLMRRSFDVPALYRDERLTHNAHDELPAEVLSAIADFVAQTQPR